MPLLEAGEDLVRRARKQILLPATVSDDISIFMPFGSYRFSERDVPVYNAKHNMQ